VENVNADFYLYQILPYHRNSVIGGGRKEYSLGIRISRSGVEKALYFN